MSDTPMANGTNGDERDGRGRFVPGNQAARNRSHPHAAHVANLRRATLDAVGDDDVRRIVRVLIDKAVAGDVSAAKEVLDRTLGKAKATVEIDHGPPMSEQAIIQQINVIVARNPDLLQLLTGGQRDLIDAPQGGPPPPQSEDADAV